MAQRRQGTDEIIPDAVTSPSRQLDNNPVQGQTAMWGFLNSALALHAVGVAVFLPRQL